MSQPHHIPRQDELPEPFLNILRANPGGQAWLDRLPELLRSFAERWSLTLHPPFPSLSYNYVAPADRAGGASVVLKISLPHPELVAEIQALRLYGGRGSVQLLEQDEEQGALLLERLFPGRSLLEEGNDDRATEIAIEVMRRLWLPRPPQGILPTVAQWARGLERLRDRFDGGTGPLPMRLVESAEHWFGQLIPSMEAPVLLHGDLHQANILSAGRAPWLAVDPKGLIGEPAYEVGAWLRNPAPGVLEGTAPRAAFERRVDLFVERLGFDRPRVVAWSMAQAVLSAWWSIEDEGWGWEQAMACAEILESML